MSLFLALAVLVSSLIASGSIVFEPQADGVDFCKKRNILVVEGFLPEDSTPEDASKEADCSTSISGFWTVQESSSSSFFPNAPFFRMIPSEPALLDRTPSVEVPPPCASFFLPTKN
jgi:hypothetical protein